MIRFRSRSVLPTAASASAVLLCALISVVVAGADAIAAPRAHRDPRADVAGGYSSSSVLVQLTPGLARTLKAGAPAQKAGANVAADSLTLGRNMRRKLADWRASHLAPVFADGFAHPELARKYGLDQFYTIEVPVDTDTPTMAAAVASVGEDVSAADTNAVGEVASTPPSDLEFSRQWALDNTGVPNTGSPTDFCPDNAVWCAGSDIGATEAWKLTTGSPDVIIGIIDSGVYPHPEFADRLLSGRNTVNNNDDTTDGCPHGTHVAGIIAASGNGPIVLCPTVENPDATCGIAGINWQSKILPVKVLTDCRGNVTDVAEGIVWAADHGASVLNISLQFYNLSGLNRILMENVLSYATDAGALVISAAGNGNEGGVGVVAFPAALAESMAVSATTACDELATNATAGWISNFGPEVDIAAPGDDIYSTWTFDTYRCLFGTSMATPHVVGVASLVKSLAPELTVTSIRNILTSSALDLAPAGWDQFYGYGRLDAYSALLLAQDWPQMSATDPPSGSIDARRPHLPNNPFAQQGWQSIDAHFRGDPSALTTGDFRVDNNDVSAPSIAGLTVNGGDVEIQLDRPIQQRMWTTIRHPISGTKTNLGFLPGDVDGNGTTNLADLEALKAQVADQDGPPTTAGEPAPLPAWSTDIDRSGATTPADLLELIDLMNGARTYEGYLGDSLPDEPD